jgi:hypothetical protein
VSRLHEQGVTFVPPPGTGAAELARLEATLSDAIAAGARPALLFAAVVVGIGTIVSFLIPRIPPPARPNPNEDVDAFEAVTPLDPEGYLT